MRGVYRGEGPSSKVSATARSTLVGPLAGSRRTETSLCEIAPRMTSSLPGARASVNCGSAGIPPLKCTTSELSGSRRSRPPTALIRSPLRSRVPGDVGSPSSISLPGTAPLRKSCPSTSSKLPARGLSPNNDTACPSVVPRATSLLFPPIVTDNSPLPLRPRKSAIASAAAAAASASILHAVRDTAYPLPRDDVTTARTWRRICAELGLPAGSSTVNAAEPRR